MGQEANDVQDATAATDDNPAGSARPAGEGWVDWGSSETLTHGQTGPSTLFDREQ